MYELELKKLASLYEQGVYAQPFYSKRLHGLQDFASYNDFLKIPFMVKEDIRKTMAFDRAYVKSGEVYGIFSSSGTTGDKTFYVYSNKDKQVHEEFVRTFYEELGLTSTDLGGVFAPVDSGVMAHSMMWQFNTMGSGYVNCPEPTAENMIEYINKLPISIIATRPSVVCSISDKPEYVKQARASKVRMLLLGGGFLTEGRRKLIEHSWNAECYGMFGMSEIFGPMGGECRYKNGIHFLDEYLLIEVIDPLTYRPVPVGEYGIAVYTTLWGKGFPILRYWTDDYIALDYTQCRCGRKLHRFRYKGRMADCIEVNGQYIFPSMLEECLFKYGYTGEYRAVKGERIKVTLEKECEYSFTMDLKKAIDDVFMSETQIALVDKKYLSYDGHSIRFTTEK